MGWLKRVRAGLAAAEKASELAQEVHSCQVRLAEVDLHVAALDEALVDQQRRNDQIVVEWATTLDKIGRWASRQSARERKDTNEKLDKLGEEHRGSKAVPDVRTMSKTELRARAARMRMGVLDVSGNGEQ